jgi:hypothetical protein
MTDSHPTQTGPSASLPVTECASCGRELAGRLAHVELRDYGARVATAAEGREPGQAPDSLGLHPVGAGCARRLRRAGAYVVVLAV